MKDASIYQRLTPFAQAGVIISLIIIFMLFSSIANSSDSRFPWVITCAFLLFFSIFNALISLSNHNVTFYWLKSIISFVFLALVGGYTAYFFSGLKIDQAGSAKWLYIVFSIGYLIFMSIVQMMKFIVAFAKKKDKELRSKN